MRVELAVLSMEHMTNGGDPVERVADVLADARSSAWSPAGEPLTMGEASLTLVRIPLSPGVIWLKRLQEAGHDVLTERERNRADRFLNGDDADRHRVGRGVVRAMLSRLHGVRPGQLSIEQTARGRPVAPDSSLAFNIAHAEGRVVIGFSQTGGVGVDVESGLRGTASDDLDSLVGEILSKQERTWLDRTADLLEQQMEADRKSVHSVALMHLWTVKEAVMKSTGEGLRMDPKEIACEFAGGPGRGATGVRRSACNQHVKSISVGDGYIGAVATEDESAQIEFVNFDTFRSWLKSGSE